MTFDFKLTTFEKLLHIILHTDYTIKTYEQFIFAPSGKSVILRHDVDRNPGNALKIAKIERDFDVSASYYFRIKKNSCDSKIIEKIAALNHEIGYHYEDFSLHQGNYDCAMESFKNNLDIFRSFYPVKTICMHGSPLSRWDNRALWQRYHYHDFGIIGEPYCDIDFDKVLYLTDASRAWNSHDVTIRDKISTKYNVTPKSTFDIIDMIQSDRLPNQVMINIHPHNWAEHTVEWMKIFFWQALKNEVKRYYVKRKYKDCY